MLLIQKIFVKLLRRHLSLFGAIIIFVLLIISLVPGLFAPYDPFEMYPADRLTAPSTKHIFGTDEMGRDMLSRIIYGIGLSLKAGVIAVLIASTLGTFLGTIAGYFSEKWIGNMVIMRLADIFLAFPPLVMAMAIVAAIGPGLTNASLALGIVWWPQYTRLTFAQVSNAKNFLYAEAARAGGVKTSKIMFIHILPNCFSPVIIKTTLDIGYAILYTASLSFLGLGASPPTPELGTLITMGRNYLLDAWWYPAFPGLTIFFTVMGFNLIGDGIRDAVDPNLRI
jgi:peptide/nickel transport system permease protein